MSLSAYFAERGFYSMKFSKLAIENAKDLRFGVAPKPLTTRRGMVIGGGTVYPELNFTLPTMFVNESTVQEVQRQYTEIIHGALSRAVELDIPGLVVEFETLPPMTENPDWGLDIAQILMDAMEDSHAKHGLKTVFRMTPNDTREMVRPPVMRSGELYEKMIELFDRSAEAGAELLSIESVGGKEVCDDALTKGDIAEVVFALGIMGVRDMRFLWSNLKKIADRHQVWCAGDTACGFGNTAMVLAEQKMIPRVFAAVVRAITAVRSLVAYECGAVGPGKDCGYENIILKAITGYPMANEGKTAACAHLSPVGNVAGAACDTWSNESVQNIKLLGGMAPTCYTEQLAYDCRVFNQANSEGVDSALALQRWMVEGDIHLDPQAFVISPDSAIQIGKSIVSANSPYLACKSAGLMAIQLIRQAKNEKNLRIVERELPWLDIMEGVLDGLPADENAFIDNVLPTLDHSKFIAAEYDLA
jgi:methanol--5-hydroxybenzimidazolylcobamide Co-methyltransferase